MPLQAVIFDMDGVLVDSEAYWLESRVEFARTLGKTWTMDDQRFAMGRNTVEWAQVMRERLDLTMPLEDIIERVRGGVISRLEARLPVLPGALDAVRTAASAYRVALASGSPTLVIQKVMSMTGLDQIFETLVYGDDMAHGKPSPDIYLEAAHRLDLSPEVCIGIEDSANGLRSLKAAGMRAIAVPSPGFALPPEVLALADRVLLTLEDFSLDMLHEMETAQAEQE